MRRLRSIMLIVLLSIVLIACATFNFGVKPWQDRSPKEKALAMLEFYNAQFKDTMTLAFKANLTESEKQVVRIKKKALQALKPIVALYVSTVEGGGVPSIEDEQKILSLVSELGGKL